MIDNQGVTWTAFAILAMFSSINRGTMPKFWFTNKCYKRCFDQISFREPRQKTCEWKCLNRRKRTSLKKKEIDMVCFKATLWCVTSKPPQHVLITIIWQEGKALCQTKRYLTYRKVTSCDIFGVTTQRTLATMGSDESVFWANAKSAFEWQGDSSWVSSSCYVPSALCLSTWC